MNTNTKSTANLMSTLTIIVSQFDSLLHNPALKSITTARASISAFCALIALA